MAGRLHFKNLERASLVAQLVKNLPARRETWVRSLHWEDPLEKGTHSDILAWRIPWTVCTVHGVAKSQTRLSDFHFRAFVERSLSHTGRSSAAPWASTH